MAIITLLTTLVMVRYGAFNSAVLLKNQAYEIALDIRDTQVRAVSVRSDGNEFREEYGLFFSRRSVPTQGATNQQYVFWQDNGATTPAIYQSGPDTELGVITLDSRFFIKDIYVNCTQADYSGCTATSELNVAFARPNFDAVLTRGNGSSVNSAHIVIAAENEPAVTRAVYITSTGLITVE